MITRPASTVLQGNGNRLPRKLIVHRCAACGNPFLGRREAKACSQECTTTLRSTSAKNRRNDQTQQPMERQ
jgi:hypothetical protein